MSDNQVRVILWSIPRTVSTAFTKSMSNLDDVQIINEPYNSVYFYGPDKQIHFNDQVERDSDKFIKTIDAVQMDYQASWKYETATYTFIKEDVMEAEYTEKKVIFVKDMAFAITGKLDMLPMGYRHAFLIRNPVKTFVSWKAMLSRFLKERDRECELDITEWIPEHYGFGESFQLYEHLVKSNIEQNPVIIDSDDLLANPKSTMKQFCERIGIKYSDKLLNWQPGDEVAQAWKSSTIIVKGNKKADFFKEAFASSNFHTSKPEPNRSELDDDINTCIDTALPYYNKMYALRLQSTEST
ncbi:uncharacterized protein [Antedon mediterranea]|uniref:uncharacterized protein n=1 Tax=Antedon mediterranea TaxID=105859 RepID=UPI003AF5B9E3